MLLGKGLTVSCAIWAAESPPTRHPVLSSPPHAHFYPSKTVKKPLYHQIQSPTGCSTCYPQTSAAPKTLFSHCSGMGDHALGTHKCDWLGELRALGTSVLVAMVSTASHPTPCPGRRHQSKCPGGSHPLPTHIRVLRPAQPLLCSHISISCLPKLRQSSTKSPIPSHLLNASASGAVGRHAIFL